MIYFYLLTKFQILNFRKDNPDTFIPSQLFRNCMNEFDIEPGKRNFFSELAFKKNPYYTDQYIAVYSDRKKNNLSNYSQNLSYIFY